MIKKLDNIPVTVTLEQVLQRLKLEEQEDIALVSELFAKAKEIARPKAVYREAYVEKVSGARVKINGLWFESPVLSAKLKDIHRVFAYVCTCGTEVDDWSRGEKDYVVSLWLDMIKAMFLTDANNYLREFIIGTYKINKLSSVNPGSGNVENWPIAQQRPLFDAIGDVKNEIGVTLTDSFLMLPIKSMSGLLFPSEKEFSNCALCGRENCSGRRAAFDRKMYEGIFKEIAKI